MSTEKRTLPAAFYGWFEKNKRDLPFRKDRSAYTIWISEVMLQQTRVEAMVIRYREFIKKFPDMNTLAKSTEEEVMGAWKGLGYYSRARNLRKGAIQIVENYNGIFPDEYEKAIKLSGVGDYTASAVLSLAYDRDIAVYDGNVRRVLSRYYHLEFPEAKDGELKSAADQLIFHLKQQGPAVHNEAMMELGALVCTPGKANCAKCPLNKKCSAWNNGGTELVQRLPPQKIKPEEILVDLHLYMIMDPHNRLIVVKNKQSPFLRNHWFFPHRVHGVNTAHLDYMTPQLAGLLERGMVKKLEKTFRHTITRHKITGHVYVCEVNEVLSDEYENLILIKWNDLEQYVVSSMATKVRKVISGYLL